MDALLQDAIYLRRLHKAPFLNLHSERRFISNFIHEFSSEGETRLTDKEVARKHGKVGETMMMRFKNNPRLIKGSSLITTAKSPHPVRDSLPEDRQPP
ncbi:hypothetical protein CEXT_306161 [Caerostris extrusa]|uniref:Uncharacterized protein n=1 Tax=Caerostris extrusa TaxID=172846 RepID=A0AAV4W3Y1_CAEEX|nr:hypothetical protein CEXT_306161 [Caerostris extrusa]